MAFFFVSLLPDKQILRFYIDLWASCKPRCKPNKTAYIFLFDRTTISNYNTKFGFVSKMHYICSVIETK